MSETWIVTDENWSLPISVAWLEQSDVAAVRYLPGFPMLNIQRDALAAKLNAAGKYREGVWWVIRSVLEAIAVQTTEDPERLVVWRLVEARVKYRNEPHSTAREEFFAEMARSSIVNDPLKCELLWTSFCRVVLSWMLNHQRPVPMGFCDLYAVPYRPNWKQVLFQKQRQKQRWKGEKFWSRRQLAESSVEKLISRGTPDDLMDPTLLFWCEKDWHMYWSIDVRPRNMWWRMVKAVEMAKKKKRRGGAYLKGVGDTMKRLLPQTLELYGSHLQQVTLPFLRLAQALIKRDGRGMRRTPKKKMLGAAIHPLNEIPTHGDKEGESIVLDHVSSVAFVSTLSDFQPERVEMRDVGPDMDRSLAHDGNGNHGSGIHRPEIGETT